VTARTLILLPAGAVYDATVPAVHDGDTLWVDIPVRQKVRLDGIQAAELSTPKGKEVAAWLQQRVGGKVVAVTILGEYKFGGERMARVSVDGVDVAEQMVSLGLAVKWDGRGPRPVGSTGGPDMLTDEELDRIAARLRAGGPPVVYGRDGNPVLPVKADAEPRPPFDWSPWVKAITPILMSFVLAVLTYYGVDLSNKVQTASNHAEAAAVQSKDNAARIEQTHNELKSHGKQLDRMAGNVADRVPGK
jgi:hypothetical protein